MICHRHLADWLSFIDLTTNSLSLFLVDYRIKSTGTLTHLKASFGPALELSRSPRPRVFCQQVAGNERQQQGLEHRMSELENNLSEIRGSLRVTYTGLHQLAGECGFKSRIPANPDEFSLTSSLVELAAAMEEIPSKHAAIRRRRQTGSIPGRAMSLRV